MKKLSTVLMSFLVIINVLLCFRVLQQNKQINLFTSDNESKEELLMLISFILENSNRQINPFQELKIEGDTSTLRFLDLVTQPKLFFYYNELSCDPCSDIELDKLDSISNIIGSENVFLLSKNSSFKDIYLLRRINSFRFRIALVDELINLPISNYPSNYYFVLDSNYVIKLFFVPVRKNQDLNELYYSQIIKQFDKVPVGT
jgi:hypothetical protein